MRTQPTGWKSSPWRRREWEEGGRTWKEAGGAEQELTKPRQVCSQGLGLLENKFVIIPQISIEDIKPEALRDPLKRGRAGISEAQPFCEIKTAGKTAREEIKGLNQAWNHFR